MPGAKGTGHAEWGCVSCGYQFNNHATSTCAACGVGAQQQQNHTDHNTKRTQWTAPPLPPETAELATVQQAAIERGLAQLGSHPEAERLVQQLKTVLHEIVRAPDVPRLRRLPLDNSRVVATLIDPPGALDILEAVGFTRTTIVDERGTPRDYMTLHPQLGEVEQDVTKCSRAEKLLTGWLVNRDRLNQAMRARQQQKQQQETDAQEAASIRLARQLQEEDQLQAQLSEQQRREREHAQRTQQQEAVDRRRREQERENEENASLALAMRLQQEDAADAAVAGNEAGHVHHVGGGGGVGAALSPDVPLIRSSVRVRFQIIGNAHIENVCTSQSCMVSKLPIIWKQTVLDGGAGASPLSRQSSVRTIDLQRRGAEEALRTVREINQQCAALKERFVDPSFPPCPASIGAVGADRRAGACTDNPTCAHSFCR